jgi:hypothetical protein
MGLCYNNRDESETSSSFIPVIMSQIKQHLHTEEETLYEELMLFLEENEELFRQLHTPTPEEVIGYEP